MSVWDGQREAMRLMMPLLMRKKQMEREDEEKRLELEAASAQLEQERAEKVAELQREKDKAELKWQQDSYTQQRKVGDIGGLMSTGDSLRALGSHVPGNEMPGPAAPGGLPPFQHSLPPLKAPGSFQEAILQHPTMQGASVPELQGAYKGMQGDPAVTEWGLQQQAAQGNELAIATLAAKDKRDAERDRITRAAVEDKESPLEEKVRVIMEANPGIDLETAKRVATGTQKFVKDQFTGDWIVVDVVKQEKMPVKTKGDETAPQPESQVQEPKKETIWEMSELGTGPVSSIRSAASFPSGVMGGPVAEKTIEARQFIQSAQNDLIRSLSINPRFPVGEINRLQKEINLSPALFDNPKMFQSRARAVDDYLNRRLLKEERVSKDSSVPIADRKAAATAAADIKNFLIMLGVPPKQGQGVDAESFEFNPEITDLLKFYPLQ